MRCSNPKTFPGGIGRCGGCVGCLKFKTWQWEMRIEHEAREWPRAWSGTLTWRYAPNSEKAMYEEFQRFMKRVRKGLTSKIRFVAAIENGERNGRLHMHCLIFCREEVKFRDINSKWRSGYRGFKLAKTRRSRCYGVKYLIKGARVKSSNGLGRDVIKAFKASDAASAIANAFPGAMISALGPKGGLRRPLPHLNLKEKEVGEREATFRDSVAVVRDSLWLSTPEAGPATRPLIGSGGIVNEAAAEKIGHYIDRCAEAGVKP